MLACAASLCGTGIAVAQTPAAPDTVSVGEAVVVTATRLPQARSRVLADITVLERDAIERSGASCAADLLASVPGIQFARNGGPAGTTSVYLRGAESRHTAVYIDGLRLDAQATGGAAWELIPIDQIDRVEVLRGPAAAVYGSDAVGGVVHFFTRRGGQGPRVNAAMSVGSHNTVQTRAGYSLATPQLDVALSASHGRSDGYNARVNGNPDDDGWRRSSGHGRVGLVLAPGHRLEAAVLASNLWGQYDQSRTADDVSRQALRTVGLGWQGRWSEQSDSRAQFGESKAIYESKPSFYRTETTLRNLVLQHSQTVGRHHLGLTLERREDQLHNPATAFSTVLNGQRSQDALALAWRADFGEHALQAHVRHDDDSEFGSQPTASLAWGWQFQPSWRVTAAAATSFRAPTLYQRFSEYGVAGLEAEHGRNLELGLRWAEAGTEFSATAWRNRVQDLIVFGGAGACVSAFGCYQNASRVQYTGLSRAGRGQLSGLADLVWRGSLDWHDPRNLDTGKRLPRRSNQLATLGLDSHWAGWALGLELQAAGSRYDNASNTVRMGGYAVVHLMAERLLMPGLVLQARVDNLAGKAYQLAAGYPTGGRMAQLGLRWSLQ